MNLDLLKYPSFLYSYLFIFFNYLVPSRSPYIERIESVDYNSIWLNWRKLNKEETRGTLRGYRIHIIQAYNYYGSQPFHKEITVGPDVMAYNVTGLPTNTYLRVWVAGFTVVGEGIQRNERWIKTSKHFALLLLLFLVFICFQTFHVVYLQYKSSVSTHYSDGIGKKKIEFSKKKKTKKTHTHTHTSMPYQSRA